MLVVVVSLGSGGGDEPALKDEDEEEDDVVEYHSDQGDFGDELVLLGYEDAKVKDED